VIGATPVTFWTLSLGREPLPEAMVSVNIRSISPNSAEETVGKLSEKEKGLAKNFR
jgi:hypothetical protein